jgi:hypothetical protein
MVLNSVDSAGLRRVCVRAEPTQLATQPQIANWHRFLYAFVDCLCRGRPLALIFHDACNEGPIPIPGSQESIAQSPAGATYGIYEINEMTAEVFNEHIVGANEFKQNIDLFIWKPVGQVQQSQIQEIISWRDAMFRQPTPFWDILPTDKGIGFPAEDGECFYWANPDVALARLESIARAYHVKLTEIQWDAT